MTDDTSGHASRGQNILKFQTNFGARMSKIKTLLRNHVLCTYRLRHLLKSSVTGEEFYSGYGQLTDLTETVRSLTPVYTNLISIKRRKQLTCITLLTML